MRLHSLSLGGFRRNHHIHLHHTTPAASLTLDSNTIPPIFKAYGGLKSLRQGVPLHAAVVKKGYESHTSVANSITSFYVKCCLMSSAMRVFRRIPNKDSVSWNGLLYGLLDQGFTEDGIEAFVEGRREGFEPNVSTLVLLLQGCWKLEAGREGRCIHGFVVRSGYFNELCIKNSLLCIYARFRDVGCAEVLFEEMGQRDVISWSVMASVYLHTGEASSAASVVQLFRNMIEEGGACPDGHSMVGVLQASGVLGDRKQGKMIHTHVVLRGFLADVFVGNSLVDMYSKCSDLNSAYAAFREMPEKNLVTWNTMLSGLVRNERDIEALELYESMRETGVAVDEITLVNLLQLSKSLGQPNWCRSIHSMIVRRAFGSNVLVVNTMLDAYAKCGLINLSAIALERMEGRNLISWSTLIGGYTHCGMPDEAINLFGRMLSSKEKPNAATILSLLEACSLSACLETAKGAHGVAFHNYLTNEIEIGTAVLDMYAKCGDLITSRRVFDEMLLKNVISWSAMIRAYGMHGSAREALSLYHEMVSQNVKPNKVTMLSVLAACSHGGLVEDGLSCFKSMLADPSLDPCKSHYSCVIDMLGRAGNIEAAIKIIRTMAVGMEASTSAWSALLSACRRYGNNDIIQRVASRVIELEPMNSSGYVVASSLFAGSDGSGEEKARMRVVMREKGVKVVGGYSSVHVGRRTHWFLASDGSHPESREIYLMVENLHCCMESEYEDCYEIGLLIS